MKSFLTGSDLLSSIPQLNPDFELLSPTFNLVQQAIMPVVGWNGHTLIPFGTCFSISSTGIALTAWHVIETFVHKYGAATHSGNAGLYVVYESDTPTQRGELGGPLPVVSYDNSGADDICALTIELPMSPRIELPAVSVHVGIPALGSACHALGYPHLTLDGEVLRQEVDATSVTTVEYERRLAISSGQVQQIHQAGRDAGMDYPCFQNSARFDHGMSGGPVVTGDGRVCGMVCRGWDLIEDDPLEPISFASLLAPFLELSVLQGSASKKLAQLDLDGVISVTGHENLDIEKTSSGKTLWYGEPKSP